MDSTPSHAAGGKSALAYWALISVCFFWGTTYLGIRVALESVPPLVLVSTRFILSGGLLLLGARLAGFPLPQGREWLWSALHGCLTVGIGTGGLVFAETHISSSLAALFVATGPFWMVAMEALVPGGEQLKRAALAGMVVGLCGVLMLVVPGLLQEGAQGPVLLGFLILQLSAAGWALGSVLMKKHQSRANPVVAGAVQQLGAGLVFALPAITQWHKAHWDAQGIAAIAYLVVFGSIVGYSSYAYALRHLPTALVSIYNYVNPMVAALLGWMVYREPFGPRELAAMIVIFAGVALVKWATGRR
jgi:drug/metabolite transporter (DMT)-like permease